MSDKMKAAALSATKGLSRVQAERAAANATRNVNAYGQKEEGPSRWQEKKEAKTQMYLKSTEKQATLNEKKCQKCRKSGHWTYECQKQVQVPETSKLDIKSLMSQDLNDVEMKKEEKGEKSSKKEKSSKRKNKKRKHRCRSSSESSDSESDREDDGSRRKKKKHSRRSNRGR